MSLLYFITRMIAGLATGLMASTLMAQTVATRQNSVPTNGEYVAKSGDCAACHTAPGGLPYAGGLAIGSPVGTIYSSNITPSMEHGIGAYTRAEFDRVMRKGIRRDGANIYPAMPYTDYKNYSEKDMDALFDFFKNSVKPVEKSPPQTDLPFPANIRLSMFAWNLLFLKNEGFKPDSAQSVDWNRGKYLVEGAGHCGSCHTPRGYLMQELSSRAFTGSQVGAWYAPNITNDKVNGIGMWSADELKSYLQTGVARAHGARAAGTMGEAVEKSFQYMTDEDINAITTFVLTIPPAKDSHPTGPRFDRGKAGTMVASTRGTQAGTAGGPDHAAVLFQGLCASCHAVSAKGSKDGHYPALFGSSTTGANSSNLVATILNGVNRTTAAGQAFMPGFGGKTSDMNQMTDADVALVANYVMTSYGGLAPSVTEKQVAVIRRGGPTSSLIPVAQVGIGLAVVAAIGLLTWWFLRSRRKKVKATPARA